MNSAVGKIDDFLRMPEREHAVGTVSRGVPGVGRCRRVSQTQRDLHVAIPLDGSREAAVADHQELPVPILGRHPQLGVDVGIGRRLEDHRHATVLRDRQGGRRRRASLAGISAGRRHRRCGRHEDSGRDDGRGHHCGLGNRERTQALARRRRHCGGEKREAQAGEHGDPPFMQADYRARSTRPVAISGALEEACPDVF